MASMIHFCGVIFYALFASGELQPWAEPPEESYEEPSGAKSIEKNMETTALNEVGSWESRNHNNTWCLSQRM